MRGRTLKLSMAVLTAALAVSLAIALAACGEDETAGGGEPIKIGAIVSLTGTYAGLGEPEKNVLEMEVKRINDAGGVNGRPIEVIIEDDATDEAKAVAAASKLIEQDERRRDHRRDRHRPDDGDPRRHRARRASRKSPWRAARSSPTRSTRSCSRPPGRTLIVVPFTLDYLKAQGITKIGLISDSGGFGKDGQAVIEADGPGRGRRRSSPTRRFNPGDTDMTRPAHQDQELRRRRRSSCGPPARRPRSSPRTPRISASTLPIYGSHGIARTRVHRGRRRRGRGRHVRRRQDPHPRGVRRGHRGLHGGDRLHRPLHDGLRRRPEHVRGSRLRRAVPRSSRRHGASTAT